MAKFRKKPIVIEAVRFINQPTEIEGEEPEWYRVARTIDPGEVGAITYSQSIAHFLRSERSADGVLLIHTLEGVMRCDPGDWIIRGIMGELYSCKNTIFAESYERVEE